RSASRGRGAQDEEEDRHVDVARTRARERLLLSGAIDFERWGEQRSRAPAITWLGPALAGELSVQALTGLLANGQQVLDLPLAPARRTAVRWRLNAPAASDAAPFGADRDDISDRDACTNRGADRSRGADASRTDASRADPSRADSSRADSSRADSSRADSSRHGQLEILTKPSMQ